MLSTSPCSWAAPGPSRSPLGPHWLQNLDRPEGSSASPRMRGNAEKRCHRSLKTIPSYFSAFGTFTGFSHHLCFAPGYECWGLCSSREETLRNSEMDVLNLMCLTISSMDLFRGNDGVNVDGLCTCTIPAYIAKATLSGPHIPKKICEQVLARHKGKKRNRICRKCEKGISHK